MFISALKASVPSENWVLPRIEFQKLNLIVGDSGAGKTRLLTMIFGLAMAAIRHNGIRIANYKAEFSEHNLSYRWSLRAEPSDKGPPQIIDDTLLQVEAGKTHTVVRRTSEEFRFLRRKIPKLSLLSSSIFHLQEEDVIRPIFKGFAKIRRISFTSNILEESFTPTFILKEAAHAESVSDEQLLRIEHVPSALFFLKRHFPSRYEAVDIAFRQSFSMVEDLELRDLKEDSATRREVGMVADFENPMYMLFIKERGVSQPIPANRLSSGMQKVLRVLTDLCCIPDGGVYLLDEYENSLGVSAIDFFPTFLSQIDRDIQIFLTSHHPYLINKISPEHWIVLSRKGEEIRVRTGQANLERYGKSRQKRFIQLINDPFYNRAIQ